MLVNKILDFLLSLFSLVLIPFQMVTTFILGILVRISFGLLLLVISAIWAIFFFFPLMGLSYIYEKVALLRIPVGIVGIPVAVLGYIFCSLMPSMGEFKSRIAKLTLCSMFPYTWHCFQYSKANPLLPIMDGYYTMKDLFNYYATKPSSLWRDYIIELEANYEVQMQLRSERIENYLKED